MSFFTKENITNFTPNDLIRIKRLTDEANMSLEEFEKFVNKLRASIGMNVIKFDDEIRQYYYNQQTYDMIFNPNMRDDYVALPQEYRIGAYYEEVMAFIANVDSKNFNTDRPKNPSDE